MLKEALHAFGEKRRQRDQKKFSSAKRSLTVGASEVGQCLRKVFFTKAEGCADMHVDRDPDHVDGWGAARRGTSHETHFWVPAMRAAFSENLLYAGGKQRTLTVGKLSATPDGLLINQPRDALAGLFVPDIGTAGDIVIEAKTIDPRVSLTEARAENVFQAQVQMGMFRETTEHNPSYAIICYTNASFFDDVTEFAVKFDPKVYEQAKKRADLVFAATNAEELRPEGWIAGGKECGYCPFKRACGRIRSDVPANDGPVLDTQLIAEFFDLARQEKSWATKASAADDEKRNIQHSIKERLKEINHRRVDAPGLSVIWSTVKGRPSYDMVKLRDAASAAGLDIEQFSTVGDLTDRLLIKLTTGASA